MLLARAAVALEHDHRVTLAAERDVGVEQVGHLQQQFLERGFRDAHLLLGRADAIPGGTLCLDELRALAGIASTADLLPGASTLRAQCLHLAQQRPI